MRKSLASIFIESKIPPSYESEVQFTSIQSNLISSFLPFLSQKLGISPLPKIILTGTKHEDMTTGSISIKSNLIKVLAKVRLLADIFRTLSHEMTHYKQIQEGRDENSERKAELEGEADVLAGQIVYEFAHLNEENSQIYSI